MTSLRRGLLGFSVFSALLALGCGSGGGDPAQPPVNTGGSTGGSTAKPIASIEATALVNKRMDDLVAGLGDSTAQLDTTGSTTVASGSVDQVVSSSSSCSGSASTGGGSSTPPTRAVDDAPQSTTKSLDDLLHRVAQEAKDHIFREEFVELKDGNQVVYKVDAASACGSDTVCLDKLTANPVRFLVTANADDSLGVSLLVGQAQINPGTAVLGSKKLSLRVDLARALDALRLYVNAENQKDLPEQLAGVVEGSIEKRAENDFAISSSIIEKLDLLVGQSKGKAVAVTVLPSSPTAPTTLLTINSNTNTLGYSLNLGAIDARVAGNAVCNNKCGTRERTGTFVGHLAGATGAVTVTKDAQELTLSTLGLGSETSYVGLNNDRLGAIDLNQNNGRKLSLTFKKTPQGTLVTFDPALDMKLAITLNKLSDSLRVDMPAWLEDEIFDVMLGGAAKPSVLIPAVTCDAYGRTSKSQLQVVTGALSLNSSSLVSPLSVAAGMCLLPVDGSASDANPLSRVRAGVCQ